MTMLDYAQAPIAWIFTTGSSKKMLVCAILHLNSIFARHLKNVLDYNVELVTIPWKSLKFLKKKSLKVLEVMNFKGRLYELS